MHDQFDVTAEIITISGASRGGSLTRAPGPRRLGGPAVAQNI